MTETTSAIEEGRKKARIEIIPLIDVIFFLLATFVLFTLSLDKIASLPVRLPSSDPNPGQASDDLLSIQVSAEGAFYWRIGDGAAELVAANEIAPRLVQFRQTHDHDARVIVRGDRKAKFGPAIIVFDEARRAGIEQVSIETMTSATGK